MTLGTENRNNGHEPRFEAKGFSTEGGALKPNSSGSDDKIILTIGKEERELLMKADFINEDHVKKAILAIREARDFNLKNLENMIWDAIAGMTAIGGKRTDRFVTLRTGVWLNDNNLRKMAERDKKEQKQARE